MLQNPVIRILHVSILPVCYHEISESCMQVIESIVARSMDCISLSVNCAKCLLRDPSMVARSIDWCANDRSIVRAEQSMDSANRSTARNKTIQILFLRRS